MVKKDDVSAICRQYDELCILFHASVNFLISISEVMFQSV
jgi:hypothetical protein